MKVIAAIILLLGLEVSNSPTVAAVLAYGITPGEMARLPPSCAARMKSDKQSPEYQAWRKQIGENFADFHHYCHGINFINRYWGASSPQERRFYLQQAIAEFHYIERAQKPDFTMGAELYSNLGEVFKLMGKPGEAIRDFTRALTINPKIVKPYLQLADLYEGIKDRVHALEVITEGLRNVPDSKSLQHRYLELGGKLPYPEPIHSTPIEADQPVTAPPKKAEAPTAAEKATDEAPTPAPAIDPAAPDAPPPIGSPKNPYCRFCTD